METINLTALGKNQLKSICKDKGLKNYENLTNTQLKELIQTGKYTEAVKVQEVPKEKTFGTFKIGNGSAIQALSNKTSIANIRFLVRNYMLRNGIEKAKDVSITLPNGSVIQADKINTLKQYIVECFQGVYAAKGTNEFFDSQVAALNSIATHANTLVLEWSKIGVTDDKVSNEIVQSAVQQILSNAKVSDDTKKHLLELIVK